MILRHALSTCIYLLLVNDMSRAAFAQDNTLYSPLTWTRGDPDTAGVPAPMTTPAAPTTKTSLSQNTVAKFSPPMPPPFDSIINKVAHEHQLDPRLLHAMIHVESRYNPDAVSGKGATGLMQVMPATGERFGYTNLSKVSDNIRAGAAYLKWLLDHFDHNLELSIAAYNAGEGAVKKYGRQIPPYPETREYVTKVMARYRQQPMVSSRRDTKSTQHSSKSANPLMVTLSTANLLNAAVKLLLSSPETKYDSTRRTVDTAGVRNHPT